jgi:hypothetical protein
LLLSGAVSLHAATTERVVADPQTGFALYGFDPVAYFTLGEPKTGDDGIEYRFAGVVWLFVNEGNRDAFVAHPEVYAPRFGGYDPLGVARGVATPGHPQLWARYGDRIYLFHKEQSRAAFVADPQSAVAAAEERWPQVEKELAE